MNKRQEANALVIECITSALLEMMKTKPFNSITITELTRRAGVGRVSFYRNFQSKEDVLIKHIKNLVDEWLKKYDGKEDFNLHEAVFEYFYQNKDFYILLYKQGLSHISLQGVKDACGPKPEQPNALAYVTAFMAYGLYGWIEEWFKRGVQETPRELVELYERTHHPENQ